MTRVFLELYLLFEAGKELITLYLYPSTNDQIQGASPPPPSPQENAGSPTVRYSFVMFGHFMLYFKLYEIFRREWR